MSTKGFGVFSLTSAMCCLDMNKFCEPVESCAVLGYLTLQIITANLKWELAGQEFSVGVSCKLSLHTNNWNM